MQSQCSAEWQSFTELNTVRLVVVFVREKYLVWIMQFLTNVWTEQCLCSPDSGGYWPHWNIIYFTYIFYFSLTFIYMKLSIIISSLFLIILLLKIYIFTSKDDIWHRNRRKKITERYWANQVSWNYYWYCKDRVNDVFCSVRNGR